jgi:hypothetical protein
MTRNLLLFIQSPNPGTYVSVITHCVEKENVSKIYFAVNSGAVGKLSEAKDIIRAINNEITKLANIHPDIYSRSSKVMPSPALFEDTIIRVLFTNPESSVNDLSKNFRDFDQLIVDITACNKKVSSDVISSYISSGINHVCCFELDDRVYSHEWKQKSLSKNYHDINSEGIAYYEYIDFSRSGTTIDSFNRMRSQGKILRILLAISVALGLAVLALIQQQSAFAQYIATAFAAVTTLGLFLGLANDIFGIFDRLK